MSQMKIGKDRTKHFFIFTVSKIVYIMGSSIIYNLEFEDLTDRKQPKINNIMQYIK